MNEITNIADRIKWNRIEEIVLDNFPELSDDPKTREYLVACMLAWNRKYSKQEKDHFEQKWRYFMFGMLSGSGFAFLGFLLGKLIDTFILKEE